MATKNPRSASLSFAIKATAVIYAVFEAALLLAFFLVAYDRVVEAWSVFSAAFSVALAATFVYANIRFWTVLSKVVLHAGTGSGHVTSGGAADGDATSLHAGGADTASLYYDDQSDADTISMPLVSSPPDAYAASLNSAPRRRQPAVASLLQENARQKLRRITLVSVVCTLCSCVKAAIEALQCAVLLTPNPAIERDWWLISLLYFSLSEVLPGVLVLLALRKPSSPPLAAAAPSPGSAGAWQPRGGFQTPAQRPSVGGPPLSERGSERGASMYSAASAGWHGPEDESLMYT